MADAASADDPSEISFAKGEILDIVDKKSHAFLEWQNHRGTRNEKKYRTKYCVLRKLAKKKVEERQVEYWDELSLEIEQAIKQHDPATAYRMIKEGEMEGIERGNYHEVSMILNKDTKNARWY